MWVDESVSPGAATMAPPRCHQRAYEEVAAERARRECCANFALRQADLAVVGEIRLALLDFHC